MWRPANGRRKTMPKDLCSKLNEFTDRPGTNIKAVMIMSSVLTKMVIRYSSVWTNQVVSRWLPTVPINKSINLKSFSTRLKRPMSVNWSNVWIRRKKVRTIAFVSFVVQCRTTFTVNICSWFVNTPTMFSSVWLKKVWWWNGIWTVKLLVDTRRI